MEWNPVCDLIPYQAVLYKLTGIKELMELISKADSLYESPAVAIQTYIFQHVVEEQYKAVVQKSTGNEMTVLLKNMNGVSLADDIKTNLLRHVITTNWTNW